jgi:hypothetical protein
VAAQERYQVSISNRFATFEIFHDDDDDVDINRAWECVTENSQASAKDSLGHYELK